MFDVKNPVKLIGPFKQVLTMGYLPLLGPLHDSDLEVIPNAGLLISEGAILRTGSFEKLRKGADKDVIMEEVEGPVTVIPGLIDPHTHICFAGSRAVDYAKRLEGVSYLEIASGGGGIWDTVLKTRRETSGELLKKTSERARKMLNRGVTTVEIKSGYGLNLESELKMLRVIKQVGEELPVDVVPTCLAAHIIPRDFEGGSSEYLAWITGELLPQVWKEQLAKRVDIFIEKGAFGPEEAINFLERAKNMGFDLTVHADQFTTGGSRVAVSAGACSADHLEASGDKELQALAASDVTAVALPGASLGLGAGFAPARKILDAGVALAIGSDWNPGSAPMGDLLTQAAVLGAFERLSLAETLAAVTCRAARALNLADRGILKPGMLADFAAFPTNDYREILYNQGQMKPAAVWKRGERISNHVS